MGGGRRYYHKESEVKTLSLFSGIGGLDLRESEIISLKAIDLKLKRAIVIP
jgi:hypothetical protein